MHVEATGTTALNTEDATLGNNFDNHQISQLPLESRDVLKLAYAAARRDANRLCFGCSQRAESNITLDGVDVNDQQIQSLVPGQAIINSLKNSRVAAENSEALEEFRVTTMNANSSQGRSSAAQVNLVSKSGTRTISTARLSRPIEARSLRRTTSSIIGSGCRVRRSFATYSAAPSGGPIKKDKFFFFYSYGRLRQGKVVLRSFEMFVGEQRAR